MRRALVQAVRDNNGLKRTSDATRQWQELIVGPISIASNAIAAPVLIVTEALDESGEENSQEQILRLLAGKLNTSTSQLAELPANFCILVTSRPLEDLGRALHTPSHVRHISLDDVPQTVTSSSHFKTLAQKSDGLFEWARLTCEYIKGTNRVGMDPKGRFNAVVAGRSADIMPEEEHEEGIPIFHSVMGQIIASVEPLPMPALTAMRLHFPQEACDYKVGRVIGPLGSLLTGITDSHAPIRPIHASFYDFLTDKSRSHNFFVDTSSVQNDLAFASLRVMERGLRFNICSLENSYLPNSSIPDLEKRIKDSILAELSYSCRFWGTHIGATSFESSLAKEVEAFFDGERLLWWLEALALMKGLSRPAQSLPSIADWFEGRADYTHVSDAARDTQRFVRTFAATILRSTPHLYLSAFPFAPIQSSIFLKFAAKRFQLLYCDGVECESEGEMGECDLTAPCRSPPQSLPSGSPTGSLGTIHSIASTTSMSAGSRSIAFVPPLRTIPSLSDLGSDSANADELPPPAYDSPQQQTPPGRKRKQNLSLLFIYREAQGSPFHCMRVTRSYEVIQCLQISTASSPSHLPDHSFSLSLDLSNILSSNNVVINQVTTISATWPCSPLTELWSAPLRPSQSARTSFGATSTGDCTSMNAVSAFVSRNLSNVLHVQVIVPDDPPPLELLCGHVSQSPAGLELSPHLTRSLDNFNYEAADVHHTKQPPSASTAHAASQPSPLQWLINDHRDQWTVISRKIEGQEHVWVAISDRVPRVGPPPISLGKRSNRSFDCGVLQDNDWTLNSDYWESRKPHRAYIPLAPDTHCFPAGHWISAAWALGRDWGTSGSDGWCLTPESYSNILETRNNVETLLHAITATYGPKHIYPTPPPLYLPWLESSFSSEEELAAALGEARRQVLDQYGFIAYHLARDHQWRSRPDLIPVVTRLENTGLVKCSYWGAIIDPAHINFEEICSLLEDGVPIHYQWHPADVGPLDPCSLRAEDYDDIIRARNQAPLLKKTDKPRVSGILSAPVRSLPSRFAVVPQGVQEIDNMLGDLSELIAGPPTFLNNIIFPNTLPEPTATGTLVTSFRAGVKIARDLFLNSSASPADSIPFLLQSGAEYRVFTPPDRSALNPDGCGPSPPYLNTCHTHAGINLKTREYWSKYERNSLVLPPSLPAPCQALIRTPPLGDVSDGGWDDSVTMADIGILIGQSPDGAESCWPPHDVWSTSSRWKGFWSESDEIWFQSQLANLSSANLEAPKNRREWKRFFHPRLTTPDARRSTPGSEAFSRQLLGRLG
ncbi:hypothetical protein EV702DRAFT_1246600 [Suillus placidus]|uniref:Uncharacterized protein n=1 Tax=Suillus placidus TaxID=48579 RepID=A0A9P6ZMF3_9AGAM|nr:hypothetical protein EV702DRAFT_1246600 [Suillus placidus]